MKVLWNKYSEKRPDCKLIWYSRVGSKNVQLIYIDKDEIFVPYADSMWAEAHIEFPQPPEKPLHRCEDGQDSILRGKILVICEESPKGQLHLSVSDKCKTLSVIEVQFCPFCGFTGK